MSSPELYCTTGTGQTQENSKFISFLDYYWSLRLRSWFHQKIADSEKLTSGGGVEPAMGNFTNVLGTFGEIWSKLLHDIWGTRREGA